MKRGLISELDAETIEATLKLVLDGFPDEEIMVCEIGLYNCATSVGIKEFISSQNRDVHYIGIDSERDKPIITPFDMELIIGDSHEVYYQLPDELLHFCFIDGCHSYVSVIQDFFCYMDKIKVGGYLAFHDTGTHIREFKDYQMGHVQNPDSYIAVRKALKKIGLLDNKIEGWQLIFDRADETDAAGGVCVFKKMY